MTPVLLSSLSGVALSLLFSYVPGLRTWYASKLDGTQKRLFMAVLLLLVSGATLAVTCWRPETVAGVTCDQAGAWALAGAYIAALVANQATYGISPQVKPKIHPAQPEPMPDPLEEG